MEEAGRYVRCLTLQELTSINENTILKEGGFKKGAGKLANPESMDYLLEAISSSVFGVDLYPSMYLKAASYAYNIITRHIFIDGNKRTGLKAAFFFLRANGYYQFKSIETDELVQLALTIARGEVSLDQTAKWLEERFVYG